MKKFFFSFFLIGTFASYALFTQQSTKNGASASIVLDNRRVVSTTGDTAAAVATTAPAASAQTPPPASPPAPAANNQTNLQAQGTVEIASTYPFALTLVKTTRLMSADGKIYRLAEQVVIPARGTASASVYADQNGSVYAIGPTTFSIPGLDSSLQSFVTARSHTAFALTQPIQLATTQTPAPTPPPSRPAPTPPPAPVAPPPPPPKPKSIYKDGRFVGDSADAYYGNVQVEAVISNGKITDVQFLDHPQDRSRSIWINDQAMPYLTSEALQAQSANVDIISGATATSRGFIESLSSALSQARA